MGQDNNTSARTGRQQFGPNDRKLLKVLNSPWVTYALALGSTLITVGDYYSHSPRWLIWANGLAAGLWCVLAVIESVKIVSHRRRA